MCASRLGVSRSEYLRRRLAQDVSSTAEPVTVEDLAAFSDSFPDLATPEVMRSAWE